MSKFFELQFGSGDPRQYSGLSPTMLIFTNMTTGATVSPPAISEVLPGSGLYQFQYGVTLPIAFLCDAATTSPGSAGRYIAGQIDPSDRIDETGQTLIAGNVTLTVLAIQNLDYGITTQSIVTGISAMLGGIGSTASSFGNETQDPTDLFGYMKRVQELLEGDATYIKGAGSWTMLSRGSSTILRNKTIANGISSVAKSGI